MVSTGPPQVRRVDRASQSKVAHIIRIAHRDEVEPPITEWLREAYEFNAAARPPRSPSRRKRKMNKRRRSTKR